MTTPTAHRPIKIVGAAAEWSRRCPACGVDQDELRETARTAGPMNSRLLACWSARCGRREL